MLHTSKNNRIDDQAIRPSWPDISRPPVHLYGGDEEARLSRDRTELVRRRAINSRHNEDSPAPCACCSPG